MLRRTLLLWVMGGWLLLAGAGCADGELGEDGKVLVNFAADTSVSQVTLTGVGINVVASTPDPSVIYRKKRLQGRIDWRSSGTDYTAVVDVQGGEGSHGDEGVLPAGTLGCDTCSPLIRTKGEAGGDRKYTLLFSGTRILRFSKPHVITGS